MPSCVHSENFTSATSSGATHVTGVFVAGGAGEGRLVSWRAARDARGALELRVRKPPARMAYVDQRAVLVDAEDEGAEAGPSAPRLGEAGDDRLLAQMRLHLQPLTAAVARPVRACAVLCDDPLDACLLCRLEEGLPLPLHVVAQLARCGRSATTCLRTDLRRVRGSTLKSRPL